MLHILIITVRQIAYTFALAIKNSQILMLSRITSQKRRKFGYYSRFPSLFSPLDKTTSRRSSENVPIKRLDANGRIRSGTPFGLTQDVNLTIIYKMNFWESFFSWFHLFIRHCTTKVILKTWYVLIWSYYVPGRFDQSRSIRGRPQDVVRRRFIIRNVNSFFLF